MRINLKENRIIKKNATGKNMYCINKISFIGEYINKKTKYQPGHRHHLHHPPQPYLLMAKLPLHPRLA